MIKATIHSSKNVQSFDSASSMLHSNSETVDYIL